MASPISTGGGGIHFESRVVAYYFTSLLNGGTVLGHLPNSSVSAVKCQRKNAENPLDDIKVYCELPDGEGRLDLQVKLTLKFGDNELFRQVISDCWDTYSANKDNSYVRYGAAIGNFESNVENNGRKVLNWARQSESAQDFLERLQISNFASDGMRKFLENIRAALKSAKDFEPSDQEVWNFLRRFVVLYFDFESEDSSHSLIEATDRLRSCLPPEETDKAVEFWEALTTIADKTKPTAGSHDRATLVESLAGRFHILGKGLIATDCKRISEFTQRVIGDMETNILGTVVPRSNLHIELAEAFSNYDIVEIVGEAGAGKSALARSHIETVFCNNSVLAVSARRLSSNEAGWDGFAKLLDIKSSLNAIVTELSTSETPIFFIDGAERIGASGIWATINDIFTAIQKSPAASRWKILITSRKNNLRHREHINFRQMELSLSRVSVGDFTDEELDEVAGKLPQLDQLVTKGNRARPIAKRPYLLRRLAENGVSSHSQSQPISEIDLMLDFWRTTSRTDTDPDAALFQRQEALLELGKRRLSNLDSPISSLNINSSSLAELARDDVIRHDVDLRQITFAHDVMEDWVLCFALHHGTCGTALELSEAGEPLRLIDAVQLLGQWKIEKSSDYTEWAKLLTEVSDKSLQPRWRRAVLTSPLLSTRASNLLKAIEPVLRENSDSMLGELIGALRTIEVDPNPYYLNFPVSTGLTETDLIKLSRDFALPRLRSWQPFINWYLPLLKSLPDSLVKETSLLLETIARGYDSIPTWMAKTVAEWTDKNLRRLSYGDDFHSGYDHVRKYLNAIGVERDEKFKERLLSIHLRCVEGAPEIVSEHLCWIAEENRQSGVEFVIENSNLIAGALPKVTVDFLLKVFIRQPSNDDELYGYGYSPMDFNELGIEHDRLFFSASHIRPPFLKLLITDEIEGLRLIRDLCNAAMDRWLEILREERSGTPIPLTLTFDWGTQEFWGHYREYTWNRGMGPGPYAVMSALMALEYWMEAEIKKGRDPKALFQTVLEDNYCVGAVGACCAVSLLYPTECMEAALPFITSPKIWFWDIHRMVQDGRSNSNTIGYKGFAFREAVAERNKSPHRQLEIRSLVPSILLQGSAELRANLIKTVSALKNEDPELDFEEEKENPQIVEEAKERLERMAAMCDPENYELKNNDDGKSFIFQYVPPPSLISDDDFETQHNDLNKFTGLAIWAEKSLETHVIQDRWSLDEAISTVRAYQEEIKFASGLPPINEIIQRAKIGALVGTAALILTHCENDNPNFEWAISIIREAANMPLENDGITYSDSFVTFHPVVFAAHGFMALLRNNGISEENCAFVLFLSLHPLNAVKHVIYEELKEIWPIAPNLCWETLVLGSRVCVIPEKIFSLNSGSFGFNMSEERIKWLEKELHLSIEALTNNQERELPRIPEPWKFVSGDSSDVTSQKAYDRAEQRFIWDQLPIVLFSQPLNALIEPPERRSQIIRLLDDLIKWTKMEITPPWDTSWQQTNTPYKWTNQFMAWCGLIIPHLAPEERQKLILSPIQELLDNREGENMLDDLLLSFVQNHITVDGPVASNIPACWDELFDIVLSYRGIKWHQTKDFISSGFGTSIMLSIFSYGQSLVPSPWENINHFKNHIERWVENFGSTPAYFSFLVDFVLGPAKTMMVEPASKWIAEAITQNAENNEFWKSGTNGQKACDFFTELINNHPSEIKRDKKMFDHIVQASDILLQNNVRAAAELQQRLSVLERRT